MTVLSRRSAAYADAAITWPSLVSGTPPPIAEYLPPETARRGERSAPGAERKVPARRSAIQSAGPRRISSLGRPTRKSEARRCCVETIDVDAHADVVLIEDVIRGNRTFDDREQLVLWSISQRVARLPRCSSTEPPT